MPMSEREKTVFGWLGAPPAAIADAPMELVQQWKLLAEEAGEVVRIRNRAERRRRAEQVAERRDALCMTISARAWERPYETGAVDRAAAERAGGGA